MDGANDVRPPPVEILSRYATDDMVTVKPTTGATNKAAIVQVENFMITNYSVFDIITILGMETERSNFTQKYNDLIRQFLEMYKREAELNAFVVWNEKRYKGTWRWAISFAYEMRTSVQKSWVKIQKLRRSVGRI